MLILASTSQTRQALLRNAAIPFELRAPRVDETAVKDALVSEGYVPRDIADALAELKALRIREPGLVLGCDQVLEHNGTLVSKPRMPGEAIAQITALAGGRHMLHTAAVVAEDGRPVWRHVASVTLTMRAASASYIAGYVARNWDDIRHCAGSYMLEGEGARFFTCVDGDHFAVLGLPLLPLIDFLVFRGEIAA